MRRFSNIMVVVFFIASLSGCDLINSWLGLDEENTKPKLTITEPEDSAYLSKYTSFKFSGTYANIDSIKLKIGDKEYSTMDGTIDVFAGGKWEVTVNLSEVGVGKDMEIVAYGYKNNSSTAIITTDPINITIHNWKNPATSEDLYKYLVLEDPDYTDVPAEITDIVTDGSYAYVSGYYINSGDKLNPFVYRVDPLLGTWDKSKVWEPPIDNYGGSYDPPVVMAISDSKIYVAYSAYGMNTNIKVLDKDLIEASYSYYSDIDSYLFSGIVYKNGYLYLTGEDYGSSVALVFKIQDNGSSLGAPQTKTRDPYYNGSRGYDIAIADNDNLYVAAMVANQSADDKNRVVWEFSSSDLSYNGASNNETIDGLMYGIYYSPSNNKLYATGVYPDAKDWGTDYGTVFKSEIDPNGIYLSGTDNNFHQSLNTGTASDEAGKGIIFDSDKSQAVIVGYQGATDSNMTNAKASVCVRNGATGVKTIIFNEDGYGKSCLNRVVKIGDKYFAVGYAEDKDSIKRPLIMFVPDSY